MKFISDIADLKIDYLYCLKDIGDDNLQGNDTNIQEQIMYITNLDGEIIGRSAMDGTGYQMSLDIVSAVEADDEHFSNNCYAFYVIGSKEDYPEYFL